MSSEGVFAALCEAFLPALCVHCGLPLAGRDRGLCATCAGMLTARNGPSCPRCGGAGEQRGVCLSCLEDPPPQRGTVVWGEYDGVLRSAVLGLKHRGHDELGAALGRRLARLVAGQSWAPRIDAVIPVPSHLVFHVRRGWTAAAVLAAPVAKELGAPMIAAIRRRGTRRQAGRSRPQRLQLGHRSFTPRRRIRADTVLIIDDVTTTGTTLRRATDAARSGGARRAYCAALAYVPEARRTT